MSLCSTWALCSDGKWYKDPVWKGASFFICLDDDEPPEFVGVRMPGESLKECLKQMKERLNDLGIKAKIDEASYKGESMKRLFDLNGKQEFIEAFRFFIEILESPPPPKKYNKIVDKHSETGNGVIYHFGKELK